MAYEISSSLFTQSDKPCQLLSEMQQLTTLECNRLRTMAIKAEKLLVMRWGYVNRLPLRSSILLALRTPV